MNLSSEPPREIPASKMPSVDPRTQNSMQTGSFDSTLSSSYESFYLGKSSDTQYTQ